MFKTMPRAVKIFILFGIVIAVSLIVKRILFPHLLTLSYGAADFLSMFLSSPIHIIQECAYIVFVSIYYALCIFIFIIMMRTIKKFTARLWSWRLARVGLHNPQGETPLLRSIKRHKNKNLALKGWLIYRFAPLGLSDEDFGNKAARFSGIFRGRVGECAFTDNRKYVDVEVLPWRSIVPIIIRFFESAERRIDIINMLGFASLVVGAPNGGKTYCLQTLAANYAFEGYTIIWLNRKGADTEEFRGCANYFEADEVTAGWKAVFDRLRHREGQEETGAEKQQNFLLVFDEYQSHVSRLGKEKNAFFNEFMSYIAMSRSLGFVTLVGTQSAYAEDMPKARDLYSSTVVMGNLKRTQKSLYFETDTIEQLAPARKQGDGNVYRLVDNSVEKITVAPMADEAAIKCLIADALNRPILIPNDNNGDGQDI